ncbi:hypothetical protein CFP65_7235 [Kitasatospora sp. MMS16-BH015]|uniref:DUF402 domain-containing protein n=1 Tax=Kitasatospora sp. MMS16-BH015 TaxID=2018025 RepID=UPI000CA17C59|nr:DUF402 domain-containing protein [Kitasatospora sp. MMS16-BH015]AUG81828.1 hypothetical protein CFP65_7235 [Kitasatospora sp. MMS16-BH015]
MTTATARFTPGSTAVRRDVHHGRVWSAQPYRTLTDDGDVLELLYWPGLTSLGPTTWSDAMRTGDHALRQSGLQDLAAGNWQLGPWTWEKTALRSRLESGAYFSIHTFQDAATGEPLRWYVNFELPYTRTPIGLDTFDLFVDLVVEPDLSAHHWKDVDEYEQARHLGLIDDDLHVQVEAAREQALGLLQDRRGPFAEAWPTWAPDPGWPHPQLPCDAGDYETGRAR